jgi:[protein-PII] uridylyltransferase
VEASQLLQEVVPPLFHKYSPGRAATRVEIDTGTSDFYTIVEVFTPDRPGLLYRIAQKLFEMGLNLWMARISTKVDQVVDVFYIQDLSGAKIEDEEKVGMIREELVKLLETFEN